MRLTIFSRLILGYLLIFALILVVSVYAIYQLRQFDGVTRSILEVDHRMGDLEKKLTDSLLAEMRFESKYRVLRDEALYKQFLMAQNDFNRNLEEAMGLDDTLDQKELLNRVKGYHQNYQNLIVEEAQPIQAKQPHSQQWYKQEKERILDRSMEELKALTVNSRQNVMAKIKHLGQGGADARRVVIVMAGLAFLGVMALSFWITGSITKPISVLIGRTQEIAGGTFHGDLNLSSPPEMKELAHAFNSMCEKLKAVDKMKSEFFSTMSHELRTPLTSIKEGTSLLLEGIGGDLTAKQEKLLKIIAGESKRLIELVNSSLDLAKMEAGMMIFDFIPAPISPLIQKVMGEIEPLAVAKGIHLAVENRPGIPPVRMDPERVLQVLRNLLGNAVKFTPEKGTVRISAGYDKEGLKVLVQDSGPGISPNLLTTVFDKFQQGTPKAAPTKGTGLGLTIVKRIIHAHGGKVWAESQLGRGSSFIFVLPA